MINSVVQKPSNFDSTLSANDCADEEHEKVMNSMKEKVDNVNQKQLRIKNIVKQR